jgi:hypothetical protein
MVFLNPTRKILAEYLRFGCDFNFMYSPINYSKSIHLFDAG